MSINSAMSCWILALICVSEWSKIAAALQECFDQAQSHSQGDIQASVQALEKILQEEFGYQNLSSHIANIDDIDESVLLEETSKLLQASYEEKMAAAGESRNEIERIIYLQTLDTLWREHLYAMDTLKTGISLRGYNQKDPLVEYKKESYSLFMEFIEQVKTQAIKTLHIIHIKEPESTKAQTQEVLSDLAQTSDELHYNSQAIEQNLTQEDFGQKKIARNDPCPCGSGKKYKLCHGKSGPKKGMLAQ